MFSLVASQKPQTGELYALFDTSLDRDKELYLPEDYTFCKRWRDMGGEIWADLQSRLDHVGPAVFHGDLATQFGVQTDSREAAA